MLFIYILVFSTFILFFHCQTDSFIKKNYLVFTHVRVFSKTVNVSTLKFYCLIFFFRNLNNCTMTIRWGKKCFIHFISVFAVSFCTCFASKYEIFFYFVFFHRPGFFSWPGATNANCCFMSYYLFFVILRALLHPPV